MQENCVISICWDLFSMTSDVGFFFGTDQPVLPVIKRSLRREKKINCVRHLLNLLLDTDYLDTNYLITFYPVL